jgi:hypothetical protein
MTGPAMSAPAANPRRDSLARLLAEAHAKLGLKMGFRLWDGSTVPADWPADGLMLTFADEGVIAALLRRPKLDTVLQLHVAGRLGLINGTLFDLAEARPQGKIGRLARGISKRAALDVVRRFWFAPRGPRASRVCRATRLHQQRQCRLSLRCLERVLRALSRSGDGLHLRLFHA